MASQERPEARRQYELRCFTWNIAAINNNPFEYYATLEDEPGYEQLMLEVQSFIDSPGERDVAVSEVFTPAMFDRLKAAMTTQGWDGIDKVEEMWQKDFAIRPIISGFLTDKEIGSKRLASMPDRFTNTINNVDGSRSYRPTVINNYQGAMDTSQAWFDQWYEFMFETTVSVRNKQGLAETKVVCALLQKISRSKYPALSEEEEAISIPLQVLALAIFDCILVHIMNDIGAKKSIAWQGIKVRLCNALVLHKQQNVIRVLTEQAPSADVIFLQEVAGAFVEAFQTSGLNQSFQLLAPKSVDHVRDQNSLILLSKDRVASDLAEELSLGDELAKDVPVADGDICAFAVQLKLGGSMRKLVLASFHGDTGGLATTPVVSAMRKVATDRGFPLVFGLDANTHARLDPKGKNKHLDEFLSDLKVGPMPMQHSWQGDATTWNTTFNARTYLQPQLNKAVRYDERHGSKETDSNPKDFILSSESTFEVLVPAAKDNTGTGKFVEGMDFPTLAFPSDHALVSTTLRLPGVTDVQQGKCCTIS